MWIKTANDDLVNLDTGILIKQRCNTILLETTQRCLSDFYLRDDAYFDRSGELRRLWEIKDCGEDGITFEDKLIEGFETEEQAVKYLERLTEKLGAEEI